jgi:hypothetical protein
LLASIHPYSIAKDNKPLCGEWTGNLHFILDTRNIAEASAFINHTVDYYVTKRLGAKSRSDSLNIDEIYFDTPNLDLHASTNSLLVRRNNDSSKYNQNKLQVILASIEDGATKETSFNTSSYSSLAAEPGQYSPDSLIKNSEKTSFTNSVQQVTRTNPTDLKMIIHVNRDINAKTLQAYNINYARISLENIIVSTHNIEHQIVKVVFDINNSNLGLLDNHQRIIIKDVMSKLVCNFTSTIPNIKPTNALPYFDYIRIAKANLPGFLFFTKHPEAFKLIQSIVFILICFLFFIAAKTLLNPIKSTIIQRKLHRS